MLRVQKAYFFERKLYTIDKNDFWMDFFKTFSCIFTKYALFLRCEND